MAILEVDSLTKSFGGVIAVDDVSLTIERNEFHALIGPNGAGKTSLFNVITGEYEPDSGTIEFQGEDVTPLPKHDRVSRGMLRTFQTPNIFSNIPIERNIRIALNSMLPMVDRFQSHRQLPDHSDRIDDLLSQVGLVDKKGIEARNLSYGQMKRLEIAMVLGVGGDMFFLDEPTAGLDPTGTSDFMILLADLSENHNLTVLLIEHDLDVVMQYSDQITVLNNGSIIRQGDPAEIQKSELVRSVYFGDPTIERSPAAAIEELDRETAAKPEEGEVGSADRILEVDDIHTYYGESHILQGVSLFANPSEIIAVVGPNGSGKSTTMRSIIGISKPREGSIRFNNVDITGHEPFQNVREGLVLVSQERGIFPNLTVEENLLIGGYDRKEVDLERIYDRFPRLEERRDVNGSVLSGGEEAMLAMARGILSDPSMLLLDEPLSGLAPTAREDLLDLIEELNDDGKTILLVEQLAEDALAISDRGYVLESGRIVRSGQSAELLADDEVRDRYLSIEPRSEASNG